MDYLIVYETACVLKMKNEKIQFQKRGKITSGVDLE